MRLSSMVTAMEVRCGMVASTGTTGKANGAIDARIRIKAPPIV